jgi:tetratricopeptide (TPR) repeat protein
MSGPESTAERRTGRSLWGVAAGVALVTLAVFWPILGNGFMPVYDDAPYVLENPAVREGLTWKGVAWAAVSVHSHNWHPLTWLSHMADVSLYELDPWGHHLTSLLLHAATAGMVVLFFGACGASRTAAGFAAVFFAVHPLRLESVAWVAERKDVLSGFFALATLLAWIRARRNRSRAAYFAALLCFTLGLLSKPMVVSVPVVLVLLDLWPLRRISFQEGPRSAAWRREAIEIAPFAVLAAAVCVVTVLAQGSTESIIPVGELPMGMRISNACTSIFAYLAKTLWPGKLAVYYPHPLRELATPVGASALAGVLAVSAAAALSWKRAPWFAVGWAWYLVMLLPVLGLLQVGRQGMADRYTYLPTLGVLLAATFSVQRFADARPSTPLRLGLAAAALAICAALAVTTRLGIPRWADGELLLRHALAVTGENTVASNGLGAIAGMRKQYDEALKCFRAAVDADPYNGSARENLAGLCLSLGHVEDALREASEGAARDPSNPRFHLIRGGALEKLGRLPEALAEYEEALRIRPGLPKAVARIEAVRAAMQGRSNAPDGR